MSNSKTSRIVVAPGGTRGIGLATAARFSENGDTVIVASRQNRPEVEALRGVEFFEADMTSADAPDKLIRHVIRKHGRIDILINCVGGGIIRADPVGLSDEVWFEMLTRSFFYAVRTCRAAIPHMPKGSVIINISTQNAQLPEAIVIDYCAAKAALESFTKSLATHLAPDGFRVNAISPGPVTTPHWTEPGGWGEQLQERFGGVSIPEVLKQIEAMLPLKRFTEPSEVASIAFFLASDEAPTLTGANIRIDAGATPFI